ncbi:hypothetical protein LSUE1_G002707 [Lachnellula suecica]|uniref:Uncharacterized protein n=1 Tax=Lachnellula suecica TaxID=602035 RepID=A0A8T9CCJ1_9HELO|nr:hypothetical protein LSUE1_G002707 [Lachnellula suecica]
MFKSLRRHPDIFEHGMGIYDIGADGILRLLTADRDVVVAIALSPRLLKAALDRMPFSQETEDKYRGVDGTKVPKEQWFHPDKIILPEPLSEKSKVESRKRLEENMQLIEERFKKIDDGTFEGCGVIVRSNYNLGPKTSGDESQGPAAE